MSLMIGAVVIVIIVAGAAFFMSGKSGAKNTAQSETQEKKGSEGKETAVVQEKAESADKSQSAEAREKKAKTESVLENDKEKGTGENTEKIISENQKVKNEEKVDFKEKNRQKEQLYYYINHELQTLFAAYNNYLCIQTVHVQWQESWFVQNLRNTDSDVHRFRCLFA